MPHLPGEQDSIETVQQDVTLGLNANPGGTEGMFAGYVWDPCGVDPCEVLWVFGLSGFIEGHRCVSTDYEIS